MTEDELRDEVERVVARLNEQVGCRTCAHRESAHGATLHGPGLQCSDGRCLCHPFRPILGVRIPRALLVELLKGAGAHGRSRRMTPNERYLERFPGGDALTKATLGDPAEFGSWLHWNGEPVQSHRLTEIPYVDQCLRYALRPRIREALVAYRETMEAE